MNYEMLEIIVKAVVTVIAGVFCYYVIPFIKNKLGSDAYNDLLVFIEFAIRAAKQTLDNNEEKKEYVKKQALEWLQSHNIKITDEQLDALIEGIYNSIKIQDAQNG